MASSGMAQILVRKTRRMKISGHIGSAKPGHGWGRFEDLRQQAGAIPAPLHRDPSSQDWHNRAGITTLVPPSWGISHPMDTRKLVSPAWWSKKGNPQVLTSSRTSRSCFPARTSQPGLQHRGDNSQEQQGGRGGRGICRWGCQLPNRYFQHSPNCNHQGPRTFPLSPQTPPSSLSPSLTHLGVPWEQSRPPSTGGMQWLLLVLEQHPHCWAAWGPPATTACPF